MQPWPAKQAKFALGIISEQDLAQRNCTDRLPEILDWSLLDNACIVADTRRTPGHE